LENGTFLRKFTSHSWRISQCTSRWYWNK